MTLGVARGAFSYQVFDNSLLLNLVTLGELCWAVAYVLIIRQCFRDRSYGLPLVAIAMNFTWEIQYGLIQPPASQKTATIYLVWALLDAVIVWQVFRFGRKEQDLAEVRQHFYFVVVGTLLLSLVGNLSFAAFYPYPDSPSALSGMIINFVMSVLFVFLALRRPGLRGISYSAGWIRAIGNALIFFANYFLGQEAGTPPGMAKFVYFLCAGTTVFDLIYLRVVHQKQVSPDPAPVPQPA